MNERRNSVHFGIQKPLVVGDKVFKSADDWELSEGEKERARVELGETEEKKESCLHELKQKISKNWNPNCCTEDAFLLRFLRVRKYNVDAAYQMIQEYYDLKKQHPEFLEFNKDLMDFRNLGFFQYLPFADEEGRSIFWFDAAQWKPRDVSFSEFCAYAGKLCEQVSKNPKSQINGAMGVWDVNGLNTHHFSEILKKNGAYVAVKALQVLFPWRMKKLIVLNTGRLMRILFRMCSPFLSAKISKRIILLGSDMSELHQHIDPAILPKKLGGLLDDEACRAPKHIIEALSSKKTKQ